MFSRNEARVFREGNNVILRLVGLSFDSGASEIAAGSFLSILTVGMTYFGVNYLLAGLHSYAEGSAPGVPGWVYAMVAVMILLATSALWIDSRRTWQSHTHRETKHPGSIDVLSHRRARAISGS